MQQRLCRSGVIKVAALVPQNEIGDERRAARYMFAQLPVFVSKKKEPSKGETRDQYNDDSRENASYATTVKLGKTETAAV